MEPVRSSVPLLALLLLAGCAAAPPRPASPDAAAAGSHAPAPRDVVDAALLRDAGRALGVRPAFRGCVDAAAGAALAAQACIDAELKYQEARIDTALAARRGQSRSNGDIDAIQAQWRSERDRICGADGAGVDVAQRMQAGVCRLEATAARADVLSR